MVKIFSIVMIGLFFMISAAPVLALKKRVRSTTAAVAPRSAGVSYSKAKLNRATNSIGVTFLNLDKTSSTTYELTYTASGVSQGVVGSVAGGGSTDFRDLYFGTCSHGVCTPHYNIKNAYLYIKTKLTTGVTHVKRYRIKL